MQNTAPSYTHSRCSMCNFVSPVWPTLKEETPVDDTAVCTTQLALLCEITCFSALFQEKEGEKGGGGHRRKH
jgi:hypothetical protein